jgi:uncharacterized hydrophobic protein (TIGR00271 family)
MFRSFFNIHFNRQDFYDNITSTDEIEKNFDWGSKSTFSFIFMLAISAVIATFGLLANSVAVIIGAMIIAPLMNPILALSYWLLTGRWDMIMRSFISVLIGTILSICIAVLITYLIGWKVAGTEILSRMRPNLLDLGDALASGAAAAFAYSHSKVSSAFAGIAVAVALIPPLCTVGISIAVRNDVSVEVGEAFDSFDTKGPLLLYITNFIGIIFASSMVFFLQYFRRKLKAILILALAMVCLGIIILPLGFRMKNLLIRNNIRRNLTVMATALLPEEDYTRIHLQKLIVKIDKKVVFVRAEVDAEPGVVTQVFIDKLQDKLSENIGMPVILEVGVTLESVFRSNYDPTLLNEIRGIP